MQTEDLELTLLKTSINQAVVKKPQMGSMNDIIIVVLLITLVMGLDVILFRGDDLEHNEKGDDDGEDFYFIDAEKI